MKLNEATETIRQKLKKVYPKFGDQPPWWTRGKNLGIAERDPSKIMSGLGLNDFMGGGSDWLTDIHNLMARAVRSKIMSGLYGEPIINRSRGSISITASSAIYSYSPAIMQKMIMAVLLAAEKTGRIAMPEKMTVKIGGDERSVWIEWAGG